MFKEPSTSTTLKKINLTESSIVEIIMQLLKNNNYE
jgi:hypothetical protein